MQRDPLTRYMDARREVGETAVSRRVAWMLVGFFVALLGVPGSVQLLSGTAIAVGAATSSLQLDSDGFVGQIFSTNRRWLDAAQRIEDAVGERSLIVEATRPVTQSVLTGLLGASTELAYPADNGWLFYAPDVAYVTGKGFLDPAQLVRRAGSGDTVSRAPDPDPRPAMLELHRALARRDIRLIVMPTPVKPTVESRRLGPAALEGSIENRSYETFVDTLRDHGVLVFDVGEVIHESRDVLVGPLYLTTDTHWRPKTMELVATRLSTFITDNVELPPASMALRTSVSDVTNTGDLVRLVGVGPATNLFAEETVQIRQVVSDAAGRWRPDPQADVLLLGDSFTNVFSLGAMGWGESAGLAEHLSLSLARPVDRMSQNDAGARASRDLLVRELRRGRNRLDGKRVVILQFANRELAFGDWPISDLRVDTPPVRTTLAVPIETRPIGVTGTVRAVGPIPTPGSVPYKDQIVAVHIGDLAVGASETPLNGSEALVYLWGMREDELTPINRYGVGSPIALTLEPWANVAPDLDGINRGELEDVTLQLAEPWWGQLREDQP